MDELVHICEAEGMDVISLEMDRGVLVIRLADSPEIDVLDRVSDALRDKGHRFVAVELV